MPDRPSDWAVVCCVWCEVHGVVSVLCSLCKKMTPHAVCRYAIHWHMIGNIRESFQHNVSVHHSWNRGAAIHGVNYLRVAHNVFYNVMGHTLFIEDGVEQFNRVEGNLGIKTMPSMNLLNTDQTPAVFWIVTVRSRLVLSVLMACAVLACRQSSISKSQFIVSSCVLSVLTSFEKLLTSRPVPQGKNYILNNHAVASRRYGLWFRPEISATGTSANTVMEVHPINIPILEFDGNVGHSNGMSHVHLEECSINH
eukprot:3938684-Rhodomonas_salina.3